MNNQSLLYLRKEILDCTNEDRILELEINLKHFINLFDQKLLENDESLTIENMKDIKNSISLAKSYLSVLHWKKENITVEKSIKKTNLIIDNKNEIIRMFENCFEAFLTNHFNYNRLKAENIELKEKNRELTIELLEKPDLTPQVNTNHLLEELENLQTKMQENAMAVLELLQKNNQNINPQKE